MLRKPPKSVVLLASDVPYARRLLQHTLQQNNCEVTCANSLREAVNLLDSQPFNLVVIDLGSPESASEQLLLQIRVAGSRIPVLLLSSSLDRDMLRRLSNLRPVGVLTKPLVLEAFVELLPLAVTGDDELLRRSTELSKFKVGPESASDPEHEAPTAEALIQQSRIDEGRLLRMFGDLPLLPHVVARILQLSADDETTAVQLSEVIGGDPRLCGQLLRIVNSAYFGFARRIATIPEAIVILGTDAIRSLTVGAAVANFFGGKSAVLNRELLWHHSLAAAIASRKVAERAGMRNPEEAFTAGLLHDFGRVALERHLGELYKSALDVARADDLPLVEAEEKTLGFHHAWLSGWLARKWNLPPVLGEAMGWHHHPEGAAEAVRSTAAAVNIGNVLCHLAGLAGVEDVQLTLAPSAYGLGLLSLDMSAAEMLLPDIVAETDQLRRQLEEALADVR